MTTGAIIVLLAVGAVGAAGANRFIQRHRPQAVLLLQPAPIAQMKDRSPVAVKGQVAEIFGNKFSVQDDSGRTLVDTGPRGEDAKPVAKGETITVLGEFRQWLHPRPSDDASRRHERSVRTAEASSP